MKVTSVEIHPSGSAEVIVLSFRDPRRLNPFNVKAIVGLDANDIVAQYYGVSETTNEKYYTLSQTKKEPIFQIELNPRYSEEVTPSDLRDQLYRSIASSRTGLLEIQFKNGEAVVATLSGFMTSVEPVLFDKIQGVELKLKCTEALLKAPARQELDILTLNPASSNIVDNFSTAPHGFLFEIGFLDAQASLVVHPPDDAWNFTITPSGGFLGGDVVHFSSELNDKYLYVIRAGNKIYLADAIQKGSVWPILFPGDNVFEFDNDTNLVWEAVSFYPTYWGV